MASERIGELVTVFGRPRAAVNFVAGALARSVDPTPVCLEIRDGHGPTGEVSEAIERRIGASRQFVVYRSEELAPPDPAAGPDVSRLVLPEDRASVLGHFADFLHLSERVQELWSRLGPEPPRSLLVLNSDYLTSLYPLDHAPTKAALAFFRQEGVNLFFAHQGEIDIAGHPADHLIRVAPHPDNDWTLARVTTRRGIRWHFDDQPIRAFPVFREFFRQLGLRDRF